MDISFENTEALCWAHVEQKGEFRGQHSQRIKCDWHSLDHSMVISMTAASMFLWMFYAFFRLPLSLGFREGNFGRRRKETPAVCWNHLILAAETLKSSLTFPVGSSFLAFWNQDIGNIYDMEIANTTNWGFILQKENLMISTPLNQRISPHLGLSVQALPLGKMILLCASSSGWRTSPGGSISHQVWNYFHPLVEGSLLLCSPFLEARGRSLCCSTSGWPLRIPA